LIFLRILSLFCGHIFLLIGVSLLNLPTHVSSLCTFQGPEAIWKKVGLCAADIGIH
jgi:hypothetical protein